MYRFGKDRVMCSEEYGAAMGFLAPAIRDTVLKACNTVGSSAAKQLFAQAMAVPHVGAIMGAAVLTIGGLFQAREDS